MIEYRKATLDDVDDLVRMRIDFLTEVTPEQASSGRDRLQDSLKEYFVENMGADRFVSWIAMENREIIGTSGACFYGLPPSFKRISGKVAYIMNMYTKPAYRGRGIAPALFARIIDEAKIRGCDHISLHATEMGKPIYEKFGFTLTTDEMQLYLK